MQDEATALETRRRRLEDRVDQLRRDVESLAVARFATSGSKGIPLLTGLQAPKDQVQADVFVDVVTDAGSSSLDEFDFAQKELAAKRDELEQRQDEVEDQQALFSQLQDEADAEVVRLREIEEQRLTDEAVLRALAAQQAAALPSSKRPSCATPRPQLAPSRTRVPPPRQQRLQPPLPQPPPTLTPIPTDRCRPSARRPTACRRTAAPNTGASGGTSGGRTGTGGAGSAPIGILNGDVYIDAIVCPMPGSAYGDSWGAPDPVAAATKASTCSRRPARRSTPSSAAP
jgi:hypothetical protein